MHEVDPLAGKIGKSREVLRCREPLRLEPAHLARRSRTALRRFAADNPAHRWIVAQTLGVVHVLVASETTKHRLPQQTDQRMVTVLAGARIGERLAGHRGQSECVVEFTVCQQSASDVTTEPRNCSIKRRSKSSLRTSSFDLPAGSPSPPRLIQDKVLMPISELACGLRNSMHHPGNAGLTFLNSETGPDGLNRHSECCRPDISKSRHTRRANLRLLFYTQASISSQCCLINC